VTGTTLQNRYRLDALLGAGGMGEVYRGRDLRLDREVAIKLIRGGGLDAELRDRLLREARAAAALNHPHIVTVHDTGEAGGEPFIVMELVAGGSLRHRHPGDVASIVRVGTQLCEALAHAHDQGIVHRDLKPENVLLAGSASTVNVKLVDLGIALARGSAQLTREGAVVGTAWYLAPEQALGQTVDGRADLYALGVLLYELLAGRRPFEGDNPLAVISQHIHAPVVPPRTWRADLPPELEAVILRLLAKLPEDRYASAREAGAALAAARLEPASEPGAAADTAAVVRLLDQLARGRMVGRRDEMEELRQLWNRAQRGQAHLALVSGEPGIGKTRLAREVVVLAQLGGAVVLQGGCYEFEATTPYLPFVEALRQWVRTSPAETLKERLGASAGELARLAPEIEAKLGPQPAPVSLPPQEERLRLFDAFTRMLQSLAGERGLLLFLDDLHWADHGSLALLHYLLRNLREERVLMLGTYREIELDRSHPLSDALIEWNRERLATRVVLGRFALEDSSRLLATLFGQDEVSADFAAAMHRETEGNPFFLEEVVKALIEQGQIYRGNGEWKRREVHELTIPQSVKAAIGRRLSRLSPETIEVLHTAAAIGKVFEFAELAAVAAGGEDKLLDAIDEASAAQLVRPDRGESFAFTHDKIREVLHDELNPIRQRRLHQRVGESLEKLYAGSLDAHVQDLAYHFAESSDLRKGLQYSLAAADQAERIYAHEEALSFLDRALECADALEDKARLAEVHRKIAAVHGLRGDGAKAVAAYERALALTTSRTVRAALHGAIGEVYTRVGDARALEHLEHALADFDPATQTNELALATAMMGRFHHYRAEHRKAVERLKEALALAEPLDDAGTLGQIYSFLAGAYQHLARFEESDRWAKRSIDLGVRKNDPMVEANGWEFLSENAFNTGRWKDAVDAAGRDRELGRKAGSYDRMVWADFGTLWGRHERGDLDEAARVGKEGLALADRMGEVRCGIFIASIYSLTEADRGERSHALELAERAVAAAERLRQIVLVSLSNRVLSHVLNGDGDFAGAAARCETCLTLGRETDNRVHRLALYPDYFEALLGLGRLDDLTRHLAEARALAEDCGSLYMAGIVERYEGQCRAARGDRAGAAEAFDRAVEILERIGTRLELARGFHMRGRARRAAGDAAGAREDLTAAHALFETCGAKPERDRVKSELG
jgi:tetratricopeptide (TPR) repeat protein